MAHRLLEVASAVTETTVDGNTVPPQSRETRAALAELASILSREAMTTAGEAIKDRAGNGTVCAGTGTDGWKDSVGSNDPDTVPLGEGLAATFVEAFELVREATDRAVTDNLAASDASFSDVPSGLGARRQAYLAPVLSRGHAAELVMGGTSAREVVADAATMSSTSLPVLNGSPLCTVADADPGVGAAEAALREASVSPADLLDSTGVSIDDLVGGTLGTPMGADDPRGSVRQRLEDLYEIDLGDTADDVYGTLGIERHHFITARKRMQESIRAFSRDVEQTIEHKQVPDDTGTRDGVFLRYAATSRPPTPQPDSHWSTAARTLAPGSGVGTASSFFSGTLEPVAEEYARLGAAQSLDYAISVASDVLQNTANIATASSGENKDNPAHLLAMLLARADEDRPFRIEAAWDAAGAREGVVRVLGDGLGMADLSRVVLVQGSSALSCAVNGHIEGEPCNMDDHALAGSLTTGVNQDTGFDTYIEFNVDELLPATVTDLDQVLSTYDEDEYTFYLVASDDASLAVAEAAGRFEGLGGVAIPPIDDDYIRREPINPWASALVGEAIAPDPEECAWPANTCAGLPRDVRVPLENELSEDGDAFESSWRTYLGLARRAADEADALGEELIRSGLEMDVRAEAALAELEEACGSAIDIDALAVDVDTSMGTGMCGSCAADEVCHAGVCVVDPVAGLLAGEPADDSDELRRLRECLGDSTTLPLVALGDATKSICVWRHETRFNDVCGGDSELPCPAPCDQLSPDLSMPATTEDGLNQYPSIMGVPTGYEVVEVAAYLGLFEGGGVDRGTNAGPSGRSELCSWLRILRDDDTGTLRGAALDAIDSRGDFVPEFVREDARAVTFEAKPSGHFDLRVGGIGYSTGDVASGPSTTGWPCDAPAAGGIDCAPTNSRNLFCATADCTTQASRESFRARVASAVVAARATTGSGFASVTFDGPRDEVPGLPFCEAVSTQTVTGGQVIVRRCEGIDHLSGTDPWRSGFDTDVPVTEVFWPGESANQVFSPLSNWSSVYGPSILGSLPLWAGFQNPDSTHPLSIRHALEVWRTDEAGTMWMTAESPRFSSYWFETSDGLDSEFEYARRGLTFENLKDAVELLCEAGIDQGFEVDVTDACNPPGAVRNVDDIPVFRAYLRCIAETIEQQAQRSVFANVPTRVVDVVVAPGGVGAFPATGGEYGRHIASVRQGLLDLPGLQRSIAGSLRDYAQTAKGVESAIRQLGIRGQIQNLQLGGTISANLTECAVASARASGVADAALSGAIGAAVATCANSIVQIGLSIKINDLESSALDEAERQLFSDFNIQLNATSDKLADTADALRRASEVLNSGLAGVESTTRRAERAVARALFADSDLAGRQYRVNTVMRRRMNTLQNRYERARLYAVRMAYLARRALEQRLGFELDDADLGWTPSLVEPPESWANDVCSASGIDYARLRDAGEVDYESFEDAYVGDYVRRLEALVESYRLDFPFSDGQDTAVVSLRDELHNVRAICDVEGPNQMVFSTQLDRGLSGGLGWQRHGCEPIDIGGGVLEEVNCVTPFSIDGTRGPLNDWPYPGDPPQGFRVVFGEVSFGAPDANDLIPVDGTGTAISTTTSSARWQSTPTEFYTRLVQEIVLEPGRRYRLSWYGRNPYDSMAMTAAGPDAATAVQVLDESDNYESFVRRTSETAQRGWIRYYGFFDTFDKVLSETHRIAIEPATPITNQVVDVAGFMLEDVTNFVFGTEYTQAELDAYEAMGSVCGESGMEPCVAEDLANTLANYNPLQYTPAPFVSTLDSTTIRGAYCEDTNGDYFRELWSRVCERHCGPGVASCGDGSDDTGAIERCYWQTTFDISHEQMEQGEILHASSPARGNFNYRTDSLAVNFVGTSVRDCSESTLPSTCYASGSIPFTLEHYAANILDHRGAEMDAPLFTGRIVHGRGLAAERYLTNPVSSADRALADPNLHREMRGRPLAGHYVLKLWEEPGVRFDRIEDVQILLNYRYWTRLD